MIRIVIIYTLISLVNSRICKISETDLKELQDAYNKIENMETKTNKDAVIFFSNARAGKSTLINYLIKNPLKGVENTKYSGITITENDSSKSKGPIIGHGSVSETTIPTHWKSDEFKNLTLWDTPGFGDNRGPIQDITNAFYLYHLVKNVKSLKTVLVIDFNDITDENFGNILNFFKAIENMFGGNNFKDDFFASISVIFTKVPNDEIYNKKYVRIKFKNILEKSFMSVNIRNLLKYIKNNDNRIGFFKIPISTSAIIINDNDNIFSAIKSSKSIAKINFQNVHPSMSDNSKMCLINIHEEKLLKRLSDHIVSLNNLISKNIDEKIDNLHKAKDKNAQETIQSIHEKLKDIKQILLNSENETTDLHKRLDILKNIDESIQNKIKEVGLLQTINLIKFIDDLLKTEKLKKSKSIAKIHIDLLKAKVDKELMKYQHKEVQMKGQKLRTENEITKKKYKEVEDDIKLRTIEEKEKNSNKFFSSKFLISMGGLMGALLLCLICNDT